MVWLSNEKIHNYVLGRFNEILSDGNVASFTEEDLRNMYGRLRKAYMERERKDYLKRPGEDSNL